MSSVGTILVADSPSENGAQTESSEDDERLPPPTIVLQMFFISATGSARKRRLHLGGECWRIPGRDYAEFSEHGDVLPAPNECHAACKQCFPSGVEPMIQASSSDGSSETSEAESSK